MNTQPQESWDFGDGSVLEVVNIWKTIQGEGPFVGTPATFIRLAGCNLLCPSCDTDYTSGRREKTVEDILNDVVFFHPLRLVVLTGGEPLRQNVTPLITQLLHEGYRVQVETNGTIYRELPWHEERLTLVCSPKTPRIHPSIWPHIKSFKYVLQAGQVTELGLPSTTMGSTLRPFQEPSILNQPGVEVYVQPLDEKDKDRNEANLRVAVSSCMTHGWRLSIQVHKLIGME